MSDEELERLECTNPLRAWSIDEAKEIKREYQAKRREAQEAAHGIWK